MKKVTFKDWDGNQREMYVWNDTYKKPYKRFVTAIIDSQKYLEYKRFDVKYPVLALCEEDDKVHCYQHCADIEKRLMTNRELSDWLNEDRRREYCIDICSSSAVVEKIFKYKLSEENKQVPSKLRIREGGGDFSDWKQPLVDLPLNIGKEEQQ
ncbi:hypothetical protein HDR60_03210 [bacterium]|nr:hypothetical protein [bacterium]